MAQVDEGRNVEHRLAQPEGLLLTSSCRSAVLGKTVAEEQREKMAPSGHHLS